MAPIKNPTLADVRARRAEIANRIQSMQNEDRELSIAENALVRLFGVNDIAATASSSVAAPETAMPALQPSKIAVERALDDITEMQRRFQALTARPPPSTVQPPPPPPPSPPAVVTTAPPLPPPPPPPASSSPASPASDDDDEALVDLVRRTMTGRENLEELIALLFEECSDIWWTANEVQEHLSLIKGRDVPMASVSPTLTNMKNKGVLVRDGLRVALASKTENGEAAAE